VVGLVWLNDPESDAGGRAFHARHVNGDDPDKTGYPGLPVWGLGHEAEGYKKNSAMLQNLKYSLEYPTS
jgi:hypothetical protein